MSDIKCPTCSSFEIPLPCEICDWGNQRYGDGIKTALELLDNNCNHEEFAMQVADTLSVILESCKLNNADNQ